MAHEFAEMLNGVTGQDLVDQWNRLGPLIDSMRAFAPRRILLIGATKDTIFPPSQYSASIKELSHIELVQHDESDHGFSEQRAWLVRTATDWLSAL